jgi:flavodoxin
MNGLVVCDSYFGNTVQVAEALADELRAAGHDVAVVNLHAQKLDPRKPPVAGADFLGIGGPTRMKNMSRRTRSFAKKLDPAKLAGARVFLFDTYGPLDPDPAKNVDNAWLYPGGGVKVRDDLVARGLEVYPEVLRSLVTEMKGPLAEDALDSARLFARRFAADVLGG